MVNLDKYIKYACNQNSLEKEIILKCRTYFVFLKPSLVYQLQPVLIFVLVPATHKKSYENKCTTLNFQSRFLMIL